MKIKYNLIKNEKNTSARLGTIETNYGEYETPMFMPVGTRATVKGLSPDEIDDIKSGIILAASAKEKPEIAEVVAVGPGGKVDGCEVEMFVKVGDKVITAKYSGTEVKVDGVEYSIVRQSDILAVVE